MSTYLVLGGAGAMGQIIVQDLADTTKNAEIIVGDFRFDGADRLAKLLERSYITSAQTDVHDHAGLVSLMQKADCVINATPYYFNTKVMKAALDARKPYLDLGGLFHMTNEQMELHEQFKKERLTAVVGVGATPGTTNIMTEAAAREMDEVHDIEIICGAKEFVPSSHPFYPPYMLDTLLDEYTLEAMVYEDGELKAVSPTSGAKTVDFPGPVGTKTAIYTLHSELASMPESYKDKGIRNVSFRLALEPEFHEKLKLLSELGFGDKQKVDTEEGSFTPRKLLAAMISRIAREDQGANDLETLLVDVRGKKDGKAVNVRMVETAPPDKGREIGGGDLNTGVPPSIVAQMILRGDVKVHGVLPAERAIEPEIFFAELGKRNIMVSKVTDLAVVP